MKVVAALKLGNQSTGENGEVGVIDMPMPIITDEEILIKIAYCAICGSDPHIVSGAFPGRNVPWGLGHEISGVIVDMGKKATIKGLKVGDRVTANYYKACGTCYYCRNGMENMCDKRNDTIRPGMAEYIACHEQQVFKLPDEVSFQEGALTEPVAIALHAVERADIKVGAKVAVSGGGGLGLLIAMTARISGAASVTIIEPVKEKRELAKKLGIDYAIDPVNENLFDESMKITDGYGFNSIIEASGSIHATNPTLDIISKGGTIVFFSMYPNYFEMPVNLFKYLYYRGITMRGFLNSPFSFYRAVNLLPRLDLKSLIHKVYPIEQGVEAFEAQATKKYAKILIHCNPDLT